jgi:hypothetical protein
VPLAPAIAVLLLAVAAPLELPRERRPQWGLGPLDARNAFVLSLTHLTLGPAGPGTQAEGHARIVLRGAIGQTIAVHREPPAVLDVETIEVSPIIRHGLTKRIELGVEQMFIHRHGGFLDPWIRSFEESTVGIAGDRRERKELEFAMEGETVEGRKFRFRDGWGVSKLRLEAKARIYDGSRLLPAVAVDVTTALPTGGDDFATEALDVGLRLSLSKRLGGRFFLYAGGWGTRLGDDRIEGIQLRRAKVGAFVASEVAATRWLSVIAQGWIESPTTKHFGRDDGPVIYAGLGVKGLVRGRFFYEVGIFENAESFRESADIAVHIGLGWQF